jgi:hypothetical protein
MRVQPVWLKQGRRLGALPGGLAHHTWLSSFLSPPKALRSTAQKSPTTVCFPDVLCFIQSVNFCSTRSKCISIHSLLFGFGGCYCFDLLKCLFFTWSNFVYHWPVVSLVNKWEKLKLQDSNCVLDNENLNPFTHKYIYI